MIRFQNTVEINHPLEAVFAFVANFENAPHWNPALLRVRQTSEGAIGVGTTFHLSRRYDAQNILITDFVQNQMIALKSIKGVSPPFQRRLTFEATTCAATRISDVWEFPAERTRLLERLEAFNLKMAAAENLSLLKVYLETPRLIHT